MELSAETVSVVVLGVLLGVGEWRRRSREGKVATKVVQAAASVEVKTDTQTSILGEIQADLRGAREDVRLNTAAVGRLDARLTGGQAELSARVDDLATGLRSTDATVRDQGTILSGVVADVALLKQAGGMRSKDTPAYGGPRVEAPQAPRRNDNT